MVDDSIWRDYYAAADWVNATWALWQPSLTSEFAIRIYVLIGFGFVLAASITLAYRLMARLKKVEEATFILKPRGRKPVKPESIAKAQAKLLAFRDKMWRDYITLISVFIICGFIIPSVGLYFAGTYYDWFDSSKNAFVTIQDNSAVNNPKWNDLLAFVANQLSHGALMDFLEVFRKDVGQITNDPNNYLFSTAVFIYRSFVGTFAFALLFFVRRAAVIAWNIPRASAMVPSTTTNPV